MALSWQNFSVSPINQFVSVGSSLARWISLSNSIESPTCVSDKSFFSVKLITRASCVGGFLNF